MRPPLITDERDGKLWLGDVFGRMQGAEMRDEANRLGKSLRSAQEYAQTARMCTPPVRERICAGRVLVSYTVLRVGARANRLKIPHDESFRTLLRMIEEAEASGGAQIAPTVYESAIGLGPRLDDLFGPDGSDDGFLAFLEETAPGPDREQLFRDLAAQQREKAEMDRAIAQVLAGQKAAERARREQDERLGLGPDRALAEEMAFAKAVCAIDRGIKALVNRYGHLRPLGLADERSRNAVALAQARIAVFDGWLAGSTEQVHASAADIPAQLGTRHAAAAA